LVLNLECYAPCFAIKIGGISQTELENSIASLEIDENLDSSSMFTFNVNEHLDVKTQAFSWLDNRLLNPENGEDVEIYIGYAGKAGEKDEPAITGRITAINPSFPQSGVPIIMVQGYDSSFCLHKSVVNERRIYDEEGTYQDIVRRIAKEHNLEEGEIEQVTKPCERTTQNPGESDYAFLKRLSDRIGFEFFVRNNKVYFRKPRDDSEEVMTFRWGRELISFSPRMSTANVLSRVTVRGHNQRDPSNPIIGEATLNDVEFREPEARSAAESIGSQAERSEHDVPVSSQEDADALAASLLARANNCFIEGNCECIGTPDLRTGVNVRIEGIGKRFSGRYYVKSVHHSLGDGGYTTTFEVRRGGSGVI